MNHIDNILKELSTIDILAIYPYGSQVYGNKTPEDFDFIVISENSDYQQIQFTKNDIEYEISVYPKEEFLNMLKDSEITSLECVYINHSNKYIIPSFQNDIEDISLSKEKLRRSSSQKASNSYVKAKKKLIISEDRDEYISLKSLWHSFRILDFSNQLCLNGKIDNPSSMNDLFIEINQDYLDFDCDWDKLHSKYKPLHNQLASEFKKNAPKLKMY